MKKSVPILVLLLLLSNVLLAQNKDSLFAAESQKPGVKIIKIFDGKYRVWTKKEGSGKTKLLLLHGGPGSSPEYFEHFSKGLGKKYTVYYYAQLGGYFSDIPEDTALSTVAASSEQVEEVRKALGIDQFYLLGRSWGGLLAMAYAGKYQQHLKGLILCNSADNINTDFTYMMNLYANIVEEFPEFSKYADSIRKEKITYQSHRVLMTSIGQKVEPIFTARHVLSLSPKPDPIVIEELHTLASRNKFNKFLNVSMRAYNYDSCMKNFTVPVLLLGGQMDYVDPKLYYAMKDKMTQSKYVEVYICPKGTHMAMWDDPEIFFGAVKRFTKKVNANSF